MTENSRNLLIQLFNAGDAPFFMSAEQGTELANLGFILVDANTVNPANSNEYRVAITDKGGNALNDPAPSIPSAPMIPGGWGQPQQPQPQVQTATATTTKKPVQTFEIESNVAIPTIKRGGGGNLTPRKSNYPFDKLEVGQSFHVPATTEEPEPWKKMASNVSAANARSEVEVEPKQQVVVERTRVIKGADGKPQKDAAGKIVREKYTETVPLTRRTKHFVARQVNKDDARGIGVRVFRVELPTQTPQPASAPVQ